MPPSNIGEHFGELLESGKGADVNFDVDGETFSAHKLVLAARSPVFRAQLFGPMKDRNTECIKVEDMKAPVFKVVSNLYLLFISFQYFISIFAFYFHTCVKSTQQIFLFIFLYNSSCYGPKPCFILNSFCWMIILYLWPVVVIGTRCKRAFLIY